MNFRLQFIPGRFDFVVKSSDLGLDFPHFRNNNVMKTLLDRFENVYGFFSHDDKDAFCDHEDIHKG